MPPKEGLDKSSPYTEPNAMPPAYQMPPTNYPPPGNYPPPPMPPTNMPPGSGTQQFTGGINAPTINTTTSSTTSGCNASLLFCGNECNPNTIPTLDKCKTNPPGKPGKTCNTVAGTPTCDCIECCDKTVVNSCTPKGCTGFDYNTCMCTGCPPSSGCLPCPNGQPNTCPPTRPKFICEFSAGAFHRQCCEKLASSSSGGENCIAANCNPPCPGNNPGAINCGTGKVFACPSGKPCCVRVVSCGHCDRLRRPNAPND